MIHLRKALQKGLHRFPCYSNCIFVFSRYFAWIFYLVVASKMLTLNILFSLMCIILNRQKCSFLVKTISLLIGSINQGPWWCVDVGSFCDLIISQGHFLRFLWFEIWLRSRLENYFPLKHHDCCALKIQQFMFEFLKKNFINFTS